MLQHYKVRLGDGTVLTVDKDGLHTWLSDGTAAVQVAGTQVWRPLREFLAEEESAARLARALVPPEPRRAPAPSPAPPEVPPSSPPVEVAIGAPPMVQALAEETAVAATPAPPWSDPREAPDEPAILRLKPSDSLPPTRYVAPPSLMDDDEDAEEEDQDQRHDRLEGPLLQVISTFGALLSRCLAPLTPLLRGWPPTSSDEGAPRRAADVSPKPASKAPPAVVAPPRVNVLAEDPVLPDAGPRPGVHELPLIPLKPLDDEKRLGATAGRELSDRVSGWLAGLTGWLGRLAGRDRPEPRVAPSAPVPKRPESPAAREPLAAPVPISELPVLRFADDHERQEVEDVYEGETGESVFPTVWLWAKRVVLMGTLVTGGVLAALNWQTWFPRAAELGQTVFTEIDRRARSGERSEEEQRALREATERLPQLAPETIRLLLSAGDGRPLDPPEVFQLASEAADRGVPSLTPAEATELRALQHELLGHLRPPERARVAEYDRARSQRVVFPFENPHALELVARGALAMPAPSRERLQVLLGKAVAAGLGVPAASPSVGPAAEPAQR
jgi:hypothetical protein